MNTASAPAATPAEASGSMYCARPAVTPSPAPGSCRLCVTSKTTGSRAPEHGQRPHVDDQVVITETDAALGDEHRLVALGGDLLDYVPHVRRREELPLLDVDGLARRAAATSRSVWRERKAGICRMSTTAAAGAACEGS